MGLKTNYTQELTPTEKAIEHAICEKGIISHFDLKSHFNISSSTLNTHLQFIYSKRRVGSKCELMFKYYQNRNAQNAF